MRSHKKASRDRLSSGCKKKDRASGLLGFARYTIVPNASISGDLVTQSSQMLTNLYYGMGRCWRNICWFDVVLNIAMASQICLARASMHSVLSPMTSFPPMRQSTESNLLKQAVYIQPAAMDASELMQAKATRTEASHESSAYVKKNSPGIVCFRFCDSGSA